MAKKKEFFEDFPTKECPNCGEMCMEESKVCDNCGYRFEPEDDDKPTPSEEKDLDDIFAVLDEPEASEEVPSELEPEVPLEEEVVEEIPEEIPEEELLPDDAIRCPNCGEIVSENANHCPKCGYKLNDNEVVITTPLQNINEPMTLVNRYDVDFSKAVPGEETILRPVGDNKYEAIMCSFDIPAKVADIDEKEAEMLKADYTLKVMDRLKIKDIVEAGFVLNESPEYLKKYYGTDDIDEIYGNGLTKYASVKGTKDNLLASGISVDALQVLRELNQTEQASLAKILSDYGVKDMTVVSARRIVDSDHTPDEMKKVVVEEALIRNVVNEMIQD